MLKRSKKIMEFLTLLNTLEQTTLTRRIVTTPKRDMISYHNKTGTTLKATINNTTVYNQVNQICITDTDIYINHLTRQNIIKIAITDITGLVVT